MSLSTLKKRLVAEVRGGDYTHPGSKTIIPEVMSGINSSVVNVILDIGSGMGATSQQLTEYGQVVGIDIDKELLSYSRNKYPDIDFIETDVHDACNTFNKNSFNIAVLFSSFYSFKDQKLACDSLAKICQPGSKLRILDYSTPLSEFTNPFHKNHLFTPINMDTIENILGYWEIEQVKPINDIFESEYLNIITTIKSKKSKLTLTYGEEAYAKVFSSFQTVHKAIINGDLGGMIVYASLRK